MSLGKLGIDLEARTAAFETDIGRAARLLQREMLNSQRASERAMRQMHENAKRYGAMIGTAIAASATAAAYAIKKSINAMDEMSKSAQRAGLPTEQFSKLAYAASLADVSMEDLQGTLGKLVKNQAEALKGTSQQAKVFASLGIAVTDASGKMRSAGDVLMDFADAFQRQQGSPEIMAAGFQVMGRSFQNIIPLIKDGSAGLRDAGIEAEQLGKVLSTQAGQQAERFNDNITRMQSALAGATQQIAVGMLPKLNQMTDDMVAAAKQAENLRQFGDGLATVLGGLGKAFGFVSGMARQFGIDAATAMQAASGWAEVTKNIATFGIADGSVSGGIDTMKRAAEARRQAMADLRWEKANAAAEANIARILANAKGQYDGPLLTGMSGPKQDANAEAEAKRLAAALASSGGSSRAAKAVKAMPDFTKQDQEALRKAVEAVTEAQGRFDDLAATLSGPLAQAQREHQKNLAEINRLAKDGERTTQETIDLKALETKRYEEQRAAIEAQLHPAQAIIAEMEFENSLLRMGNTEREIAIALRQANVGAMTEEGQRIAQLTQQRIQDTKAAERWSQVQGSMAGALYDLSGNFKNAEQIAKDFFDSIGDYIHRLIAEDWAGKIVSWMRGLGSAGSTSGQVSAFGAGGSWWGSALSWIGSLFGGGRATGGPVMANSMYEVNERGPELLSVGGRQFLMMGSTSGYVTPGGGSGISVTQQFINPVMSDRRTDSQRAMNAAAAIRMAMRKA